MASSSRSLVFAGTASALGGALLGACLAGFLNQASSAQAALCALGSALVPAGAVVLAWGERKSMGPWIGPANGVTLSRGALGATAGGVGLLGFAMPLSDTLLWAVVSLSVVALCMDGLDGWRPDALTAPAPSARAWTWS